MAAVTWIDGPEPVQDRFSTREALMNIRGINACAATMAFFPLTGCSSPPVEPVVAVETEVFLSGSGPTKKSYLRYANLVPTDLYGTREQQLAWYESNAVRVDNYASVIIGGDTPVNGFDPYRWGPDQPPVRIPGTDPIPTP
jgi:hypothetical protein